MKTWMLAVALPACGWTAESQPLLYPPLPQTPRLQFLKSYETQEDFGQKESRFARFVFGKHRERSTLGKPYGIAAGPGRVYVCDTGTGDVRVIDMRRKETRWLGRAAGIKLEKPINIAIDEDGYKFVADSALKRVVAFGPDDDYLRAYELPGWKPTDVAASARELFVLDIENHKIQVVDRSSGTVVRSIGEPGSREGQMFKPTNIARDREGNLYVSDTINFRIQKFSADGKFVSSIGQLGRRPGDFARPKGIALDRAGRLYVVDAGFDNVQIFDKDGAPLLFFGGTGNDEGQMYLPAKVAIDYTPENLALFKPQAHPRLKLEYLVWVTNQYGPRRVAVYGFGEWTETAASGVAR